MFKHAGRALFTSKFRVGKERGTWYKEMMSGSVAVATSALSAGSAETATATIAELSTAHKVFLSGCTTACELIMVAPRISAASVLSVTLLNSGSADITAACSLTVHYLALVDLA